MPHWFLPRRPVADRHVGILPFPGEESRTLPLRLPMLLLAGMADGAKVWDSGTDRETVLRRAASGQVAFRGDGTANDVLLPCRYTFFFRDAATE